MYGEMTLEATAWQAKHGEHFEEMFTAIAEIDLRVNTNVKEYKYDHETARREPVYVLRKKGSAMIGQSYKMASIVWRWNHPDNPKSQSITRGFPTDKLWADLVFFYAMRQDKLDYLEEEDAKRLKVITAVRGKRERDSLYGDIDVSDIADNCLVAGCDGSVEMNRDAWVNKVQKCSTCGTEYGYCDTCRAWDFGKPYCPKLSATASLSPYRGELPKLFDMNIDVRISAVKSLGIDNSRGLTFKTLNDWAFNTLVKLLDDSNFYVRISAVKALFQFKDYWGDDLVKYLIKLLKVRNEDRNIMPTIYTHTHRYTFEGKIIENKSIVIGDEPNYLDLQFRTASLLLRIGREKSFRCIEGVVEPLTKLLDDEREKDPPQKTFQRLEFLIWRIHRIET